ncbi:uncharacterized protein LOC113052371 [Carassius auratus]|uniref:Uncharacterized protein LOC113052371 n=14 Tax=Otophysi TaxID=186626 RepID=A0A6P6KNA5_CARAU|nr:uncharacterized protein LOC113052371 [Carassius auratus]
MSSLNDRSVWDEVEDGIGEEVLKMSTEEIVQRTRLLDSEIKIMKSEVLRVTHELQAMKDKIKENTEKIKVNKTLPYLVSNVIELLDVDPNDQEEDGANIDLDSQRKGKCAVIKTSTRQTYFLPVIGLVDAEKLKPGDLVGVNKDSYLILETLPTEYDSRVKAMEVDERPTEQYSDIGGLDKQIQELVEAIVLPMNHKEKFENLGIQPPKGVLMYGPPGTGKTLLARACAAQTKATFLKLAGPQLVQMFIGDGAKLVRDAFALAKEKAPSIIFIDELDAIGTKRFDSEKAGDREVQRTMLELLNQLDGFQPNMQVKVIAATNRVDILDPALLRSGRLDRKIEFPMPNEEARARIMQIHSRKMNVCPDVNYEELARCTDDFNGAQCKAVCVEAGMIALRRGATELNHEDYMEGILEVQAKKKANLQYYAYGVFDSILTIYREDGILGFFALAGGLPPYAAVYPNWLHCWGHLSREVSRQHEQRQQSVLQEVACGEDSEGLFVGFSHLYLSLHSCPIGGGVAARAGLPTAQNLQEEEEEEEKEQRQHFKMSSLNDRSVWDEVEDGIGEEVLKMSTEEIVQRTRLLDSEIKIMKSEVLRVTHELQAMKDKIKENTEKIKVNKTLPYLVSNVIELLDVDPNDQEEDGANIDLDSQRKGKCAVIKTSTRQTYFLPVIGLVDAEKLKPGDLVGVNKDSYLILETLPTEYDSRVKAMEVDERPTEQYSDIGGLDKQIQELVEAIVLPMNHKEKFENLGIQPPKGVLMYGPPGTGKTLLARACAAQTKATFLKLAGPQLVQMFIGDGAKLVRDAFALAKEKAPSIIFIDELDAIGTKRFDSEKAGDREVQRTMLELLNQLDGFQPNMQVKVIAATNRVDILDPALLRSGRLDRKIEFPMPNEEARARIMQIHSRKMNVCPDVNYEELARCTDDFNGAQCKAVCVEAGMIALRRGATELNHEDYMEGILEVQAKKKANLQYYA